MAPAVSTDLKQLIVRWHFVDNLPVSEIVPRSGKSRSFIYKVLQCWRTWGRTDDPLAIRSGRPPILTAAHRRELMALVDRHPTKYLDELQDIVYESWFIEISIPRLSRIIDEEEYTRKGVHYLPLQQNDTLRSTWRGRIGEFQPDWFVCLDESAVDERVARRTHGYTPRGIRCVQRSALIRGKRFSILPALTMQGIVALDIFEGSVDRVRFVKFLREQMTRVLRPYPGPCSVVIMDNCATHHDEEIRAIIEDECGAVLIYLPPYSPDLNPIEEAFSAIKAWLRRHEDELEDHTDLPLLILRAAQSIEPEDAEGWFYDCGYL